MKSKLVAIGIGFVVALGIGFGIYKFSTTSSAASLSLEEAKTLATAQFPGTVAEIEFDKQGSKAIYEVKIEGENSYYELLLDANSGEILKLEQKSLKASGESEVTVEGNTKQDDSNKEENQSKGDDSSKVVASNEANDNTNVNANQNTSKDDSKDTEQDSTATPSDGETPILQAQTQNSGKLKATLPILQEKAIAIAKAQINGDAEIKKVELDDQDGRYYYEIEMKSGSQEIDIEIDAHTGEVISISSEYEDN